MADIQNGEKKLTGNSASGQGLAGFMQKSKDVQIPGWVPVALIVTVAAVLAWMFLFNGKTGAGGKGQQGTTFAKQQDPNALMVEVLPQTARSFDGGDVSSPFTSYTPGESLGGLKITGIIINSNGRGTAIIEADGMSFILGVGDSLPESEWAVTEIEKDSVTFTLDGNDKTIRMER